MELFLWFILYAAFVLPVAKCFAVGRSIPGGYKHTVRNWLWVGVLWPITVPSILLGVVLIEPIFKLFGKLINLFED